MDLTDDVLFRMCATLGEIDKCVLEEVENRVSS